MYMHTWVYYSFSCDVSFTPGHYSTFGEVILKGREAKRLCLVYFSIFMVVSLPICCMSSEELGFYTEGFQLCLLFPAALGFSLNISKEVFLSPGAPLSLAQPIIRGWCSKVGQTQVYTTDFIFCVCWMDFWTVLSNGDAVMLAGL